MLGKLSEPLNESDWYMLVNRVEVALNHSVQKSTGVTPFVLFGIIQRRPIIDELSEYLDEKFISSNPCDTAKT